MPTLPSSPPDPAAAAPHRARQMAESFGSDAARYDRSRPRYPDTLIQRIVTVAPGPDLLDVGCGTGIAGRQFRDAGRTVLGIDPDARMAEVARSHGLPVEVATFEDWQPTGRRFDAVTAAQSWHWVDPVGGPLKAAEVLRPGGLLAIFSHVFEPPAEVAQAFAEAYRAVVPDSPFGGAQSEKPRQALATYQTMYATFADRIGASGRFSVPEQWRDDEERTCTREAWLDFLPTTGGLTRLGPEQLVEILEPVGEAIDRLGGSFTMEATTLAVAAVRKPD